MLLLSGGIDSPVAGWSTQKRGCAIEAIYFHSFPYTGDRSKEKVVSLARKLASWQPQPLRLHVVHFTEVQKQLREGTSGKLAVVLYRRMMLRVAEKWAQTCDCGALVTGESLGQVASQTLDNIGVIGEVARLPILRPLIAHDKAETIVVARQIGTYDTSILPYEDCCSLFVPEHPETHAKLDQVRHEEAKVNIEALTAQCLGSIETITV
jgi:thiamine biosynthesis protein ThiI